MGRTPSGRHPAHCSFCGKPQDKVRKLIAGPGVYICDGCVTLCNEVIQQEDAGIPPPTTGRKRGTWLGRLFLHAEPIS